MRWVKNGALFVVIIFAGHAVPVDAQQKPVSRTGTAKQKVSDFSVLTAFVDALLDLKGAVDGG
jgi:hypothetical protein